MRNSNSSSLSSDGAVALVDQYRLITEVAMADAQTWLRQGVRRLAIAEKMPDAILVADEQNIMISVNPPLELMFGFDRSEVIGRPVQTLLPEISRGRRIKRQRFNFDHACIPDMSEEFTLQGLHKNGLEFPVSVKRGRAVTPMGYYTILIIRTIRN